MRKIVQMVTLLNAMLESKYNHTSYEYGIMVSGTGLKVTDDNTTWLSIIERQAVLKNVKSSLSKERTEDYGLHHLYNICEMFRDKNAPKHAVGITVCKETQGVVLSAEDSVTCYFGDGVVRFVNMSHYDKSLIKLENVGEFERITETADYTDNNGYSVMGTCTVDGVGSKTSLSTRFKNVVVYDKGGELYYSTVESFLLNIGNFKFYSSTIEKNTLFTTKLFKAIGNSKNRYVGIVSTFTIGKPNRLQQEYVEGVDTEMFMKIVYKTMEMINLKLNRKRTIRGD